MKNSSEHLLCAAVMVKNEAIRIERTLQSIVGSVSHIVVLDTGSTDNTPEIIRNFCSKKKIPLQLESIPFVDFSHNRNYLLKMCYALSEFVILLDANEECKNMESLIDFLKKNRNNKKTVAFTCKYVLKNDAGITGDDRTFYKACVIRNNQPAIHYEFPVHEYLISSDPEKYQLSNDLLATDFYFYQDRQLDKPSTTRFPKDAEMLLKYLNQYGENIRTYKYLIQTYKNLNDTTNIIKYSDLLITYCEKHLPIKYKYTDEYYMALLSKGYAYGIIGNDEFYKWTLKAYQHARLLFDSVEPLIVTAEIYLKRNLVDLAYSYVKKACAVPLPPNNLLDCVINYNLYHKTRWDHLGRLSYKRNYLDDYYLAMKMLGNCK
jgi:glycosyltransferase involved in cell wall biosynthesis